MPQSMEPSTRKRTYHHVQVYVSQDNLATVAAAREYAQAQGVGLCAIIWQAVAEKLAREVKP